MKTAKDVLLDKCIENKIYLTSNEIHTFIEAMEEYRNQPSDVSDEQRNEIVESCKDELLKHLFMVKYVQNGYPIEAVPKATILELPALMKSGQIKPTIEGDDISSYCGNPITSEGTCQVLAKSSNNCKNCKYRVFEQK